MSYKISIQSNNQRKLGIGLDASKLSFKVSAAMMFILLPTFCAASQDCSDNCYTSILFVLEGDSFDLNCCELCDEPDRSKRIFILTSPNDSTYVVDEGSSHEKEKIWIPSFLNNQLYGLDEQEAHGKKKIETFPDSNKCELRIKNFGIADKGTWVCTSYVRKDVFNFYAFFKKLITHPDSASRLNAFTTYSDVHDARFIDLVIAIVSFGICVKAWNIDLSNWTRNTHIGHHILNVSLLSFADYSHGSFGMMTVYYVVPWAWKAWKGNIGQETFSQSRIAFIASLLWCVKVNGTMQRAYYWLF